MTAPYSTGQSTTPAAPGDIMSGLSQAATGATPTANAQASISPAPPGAAVSAYEYGQYVGVSKVILGPQIADMLGLPANTPVTGDQIVAAYYDMPSGDVSNLLNLLYSAGQYANTAGEQTQNRPVLTKDIDAFDALSQAIIQAGNAYQAATAAGQTPQTLSQYLTQQASSGAGTAEIQGGLTPITGGGHTYQVQLTNPQDIYQTTNSVFQQELGRNPTQAEYAAVLKIVQQGQTQASQASNLQQESMYQQQYQQQVNSRTAMHTPAATTGNVPNGPFASSAEEAVAMLQYGGYTVTPSNVAFLAAWIEQNGGVSNNPLEVSSVNATNPAQGIQAAVNLLHSPQFQAINAALTAGNASTGQSNQAVQQELGQWSGGAIKGPLDTKSQIGAATDAVLANGGTQAPTSTPTQPPPTMGMSGNNRQNVGLQPGGPSASQMAAGSVPGAGGITPATQMPGTSVAPGQVQPGQGLSSPGDNYLPSSTITDQQAASPQGAAFMEATSGANTVPYYANQAQAGLQAIINLIEQGPDKL